MKDTPDKYRLRKTADRGKYRSLRGCKTANSPRFLLFRGVGRPHDNPYFFPKKSPYIRMKFLLIVVMISFFNLWASMGFDT